ncbi:MAG: dihydroorotate dehydrogenase [Dehalococcoidia bacterium]|nr:dihydroorotate dehydrogenase [Dehalococcoidia bacterium]
MAEASLEVRSGALESQDTDLSVHLAADLRLTNPVMISSGILGYDSYGQDHISSYPLSELGAVVPKTVTVLPRDGNKEPRQFPHHYRNAWEQGDFLFLNSFGLNNPGAQSVVEEWLPKWVEWNATVVFSIAGFSCEDFSKLASIADKASGINALELNLSCPNVEHRADFSHDPRLTYDAVTAVKANTGLPVLAKLSPSVPDITQIALAAVEGGADALTICNTLPALRIDLTARQPVLGNITGGLSGMSLRPVSLALVYQTAQALQESGKNIPIIGVGGIFEAEHAIEYILAGATAVQVGSANWVDPETPWRILDGLRKYMAENRITSLDEIRGAAHPAVAATH